MKGARSIFPLFIIVLSLAFACSDEETPNPPGTQYNPEVLTVLQDNCLQCHSAPSPIGGVILDNYTDARNATEFGNLLSRINSSSNPMPPGGMMDLDSRNVFKDWGREGYQE